MNAEPHQKLCRSEELCRSERLCHHSPRRPRLRPSCSNVWGRCLLRRAGTPVLASANGGTNPRFGNILGYKLGGGGFESRRPHALCARRLIRASVSNGLFWELNPGPLAPEARIMPLDQTAKGLLLTGTCDTGSIPGRGGILSRTNMYRVMSL